MPDSQPVTALFIATNRALRETIPSALTACGYRVSRAKPGPEAGQGRPRDGHDVLLIDVAPSDGAGLEEVSRAREAGVEGCIIALASTSDGPSLVDCVRAGADDALALRDDPPLAARDLAAELDLLIARALERRRLAEENRALRAAIDDIDTLTALADLASSAAHDMNQPLTVMSGITELFLMDADPGDPNYEDMETLRRATERMCDIVGKLSAATKGYKQRAEGRAQGQALERAAAR